MIEGIIASISKGIAALGNSAGFIGSILPENSANESSVLLFAVSLTLIVAVVACALCFVSSVWAKRNGLISECPTGMLADAFDSYDF